MQGAREQRVIGRQRTQGAGPQQQHRDQQCAGEIAEIASNPQQQGLSPARSSLRRRHGQVHMVAGEQLHVR